MFSKVSVLSPTFGRSNPASIHFGLHSVHIWYRLLVVVFVQCLTLHGRRVGALVASSLFTSVVSVRFSIFLMQPEPRGLMVSPVRVLRMVKLNLRSLCPHTQCLGWLRRSYPLTSHCSHTGTLFSSINSVKSCVLFIVDVQLIIQIIYCVYVSRTRRTTPLLLRRRCRLGWSCTHSGSASP